MGSCSMAIVPMLPAMALLVVLLQHLELLLLLASIGDHPAGTSWSMASPVILES